MPSEHPTGLPDLFLDRSLGRRQVPALLRASGLRLITLSEYYGIPADEGVADVEWLELAGRRQWLVLFKDERIRYRPTEREALVTHRVRAFCLMSGNLRAHQMADLFLASLADMVTSCRDVGPFLFGISRERVRRLV
jgi:hypothetical protein